MTTTSTQAASSFNKNEARFNMIEQQIRTWEVLDPKVLALFNSIPRENFVAESQKGLAFADVELPIGSGQTMLSPVSYTHLRAPRDRQKSRMPSSA